MEVAGLDFSIRSTGGGGVRPDGSSLEGAVGELQERSQIIDRLGEHGPFPVEHLDGVLGVTDEDVRLVQISMDAAALSMRVTPGGGDLRPSVEKAGEQGRHRLLCHPTKCILHP